MPAAALARTLRERLGRWRWVLLFLLPAQLAPVLVESSHPLGSARDLGAGNPHWQRTPAMALHGNATGGSWEHRAQAPGPAVAAIRSPLAPQARFARLRLCPRLPLPGGDTRLLLTAVRDGQLDFSRRYDVRGLDAADPAAGCIEDRLPRRPGDGEAVLQLQLAAPGETLSLRALELQALGETALWRWLRRGALLLGIALLALAMADLAAVRPRWLTRAGLLLVAGIVCGCCVSVDLKARIHALLFAPDAAASGAPLDLLLLQPFPGSSFSIFTGLHALLFALATLCLVVVRRAAIVDLLLLGATTETLQHFVPGRGPGLSDMLVDWAGIAIAVLLLLLALRAERVRFLRQ